MSSPESTEQHVARRLELITNWLALLALLGIGIVWVPPADVGAGTADSPGDLLHARAYAPAAAPTRSDRLHQAQSQPAHVACHL